MHGISEKSVWNIQCTNVEFLAEKKWTSKYTCTFNDFWWIATSNVVSFLCQQNLKIFASKFFFILIERGKCTSMVAFKSAL